MNTPILHAVSMALGSHRQSYDGRICERRVTPMEDLTKWVHELFPAEGRLSRTRPRRPALFCWSRSCRACRLKGGFGSIASTSFADERSSMICAVSVRTYSWSIGSHFATPYKDSNATSVRPIIGSSLTNPDILGALTPRAFWTVADMQQDKQINWPY